MPEPRDQKLTVMLTATELEMLRALAEADGVNNMSDIVRKCIRAEHAKWGTLIREANIRIE